MALLVENPLTKAGGAGDMHLTPGLGKFRGGGNSNPFQYFCWENPLAREAWQVTSPTHGVTESDMTEHLSIPTQAQERKHHKEPEHEAFAGSRLGERPEGGWVKGTSGCDDIGYLISLSVSS